MSDRDLRHRLYERTVLSAAHEVRFVDDVFRARFGRAARDLREDFAGSAHVACTFVREGARAGEPRRATAVDLDAAALDYARRVHLGALSTHLRERVSLRVGDVREVESSGHDVIHAGNFSMNALHDEDALITWLSRCHARLAQEGLVVLDVLGGHAHTGDGVVDEESEVGPVRYRFASAGLDASTRRRTYRLTFHASDGSFDDDGFTYDWRMWTTDELTSALSSAGFAETELFVEGRAAGDRARFMRAERPPEAPRFVCYLVGVKSI